VNPPLQFTGLEAVQLPARPVHLAIGMFDGIHLGHRAVIESAVQSARESGGLAAVLTFWPHPSRLFQPDAATRMMLPVAAKVHLLAQLGVDAVIAQEFTVGFSRITAGEFLPYLQQHLPGLAAVYVGENWRFGHGRAGDTHLLVHAGRKHGLAVFSAPRVNYDGDPISSTRIRGLLEQGEIELANTLLGHSYFALGRTSAGKGLGRRLAFPTLNLDWAPELRPRLGVYAVRVSGPDEAVALPGVANYGVRPTVEQAEEPRLEVHVLGDCPFQTGDEIVVKWKHFLRPERKFNGVDELRAQIALDCDAAARRLGLIPA
jgi:riboflavin kinase/FMN adenylyltransferase